MTIRIVKIPKRELQDVLKFFVAKEIARMYGLNLSMVRACILRYGLDSNEIRASYQFDYVKCYGHKTDQQLSTELGCGRAKVSHFRKVVTLLTVIKNQKVTIASLKNELSKTKPGA